jgi:hypothetical protein
MLVLIGADSFSFLLANLSGKSGNLFSLESSNPVYNDAVAGCYLLLVF